MHNSDPSLAKRGFIHGYKLCGKNIIIDVASGSVHSVDDVTFDVIRLYEKAYDGKEFLKPDAQRILYADTKQIHPDVTMIDVRDILDDIEKLIAQGKLFTPDTFEDISKKANITGSPANAAENGLFCKALCINVSHACNMKCEYCFTRSNLTACEDTQDTQNTQDTQSMHLQDGTSPALMSVDVGKKAIDFLIKNSGEHKYLDIDFFGGEPLINLQTIKEIVSYARELEKHTGKRFRFTLTTNGLLIDDDVIAFTNKEMHNVVLSLDGRPETHDKMRRLTDGSKAGATGSLGSYDEVLPKIKKLVEARRYKGYYIRGTFTRENMDFANDILHIADLGFTEISLEPVVAKRGDKLAFTKADLPELFRQYDVLTIEMLRRREVTAFVRPQDIPPQDKLINFYHYNLNLSDSPCIYKRIAGCGVGTEYLAVTPDGKLYPCHQFIGNDKFLMGDVCSGGSGSGGSIGGIGSGSGSGGITNHRLRSEFASTNIYSREQCRSCWARFYCCGGCAANAYHDSGSIGGIYEIGCELFKKRIENAIMMQFKD